MQTSSHLQVHNSPWSFGTLYGRVRHGQLDLMNEPGSPQVFLIQKCTCTPSLNIFCLEDSNLHTTPVINISKMLRQRKVLCYLLWFESVKKY